MTKTGATPERWSKGLSVMLEKIAGVALVTKLRTILLMDAGFNFQNRLIFGDRMMKLARENGLVPEEIYSEKGKPAEDAILQQVLLFDIARQLRRPHPSGIRGRGAVLRQDNTRNSCTDAEDVQSQTVVGSQYADADPVDGVLPQDGLRRIEDVLT